MKRILVSASLVAAAFSVTLSGQSGDQKVAGYLVDGVCATNHATEPGYGANHEKTCSLMEGCIKSGFSLITSDLKVLKFDTKGNEQALALIKATEKEKDWKVVVTGKVDGQTMAVRSIALQ